jgi:predicted transcriptional regulator of viral defense system
MEFIKLLEILGDEPVFESSLLLSGDVDPANIRLQLTRWVNSGRLYRLRRGLYALAPPYQKVKPHPFLIANALQPASYVSLESALAYYGMIPDTIQRTLSVTTDRPRQWQTPLGTYTFRHIQPDLLAGYHMTGLGNYQQAFVATPEKALLDLLYFQPRSSYPRYLDGLRLQNLEQVNLDELTRLAATFNTPRLYQAVDRIGYLIETTTSGYETL